MIKRALVLAILPIATAWVRRQERMILRDGAPLSGSQLADARRAGVAQPERVRVLVVPQVPPHLHAILRGPGKLLGLVSSGTAGMSLRYGIFVRSDYRNDRALLVHELAHTAQYERLGGLRAFLADYLFECFTAGYPFGPLETEAAEVARQLCHR